MTRNMAALQGALRLLPVYRIIAAPSIQLADHPVWQLAMTAATTKAKQETPRQAKCASYEVVRRAVQRTSSLPVRAVLVLAWLSCARVGDILKLKKEDVTITPRAVGATEGTRMSVTFKRGKTVKAKAGAYTVHVVAPDPFLAVLEKWLPQRREWLFP